MEKCYYFKLVITGISITITSILLVLSLISDYQIELAREHVRFRKGFPSQANWITSPFGTLNCYLFNVTNAEQFLSGVDKKMKLAEVGPIVYRIKGRNQVLEQSNDNLVYQKIRYHKTEFDADASCDPDILNKNIILPNFVLLGAAAKLHDWVPLVRYAFNAITIKEAVFLNETVEYFLWDFTMPALNLLSNYIPNIVANCGMLYNALRNKDEVYSVQIGTNNGLRNFFRVNTMNNKTYFSEQSSRLKYVKHGKPNMYCPIEVTGAFDNSLFPPLLQRDDNVTLVAAEACRTFDLLFKDTVYHLGLPGYRYVIVDNEEKDNCLKNAMGIKLHKGMFDASKCLFNDVPSAFSQPHFYGSSYNWSQHMEGLFPNIDKHEAYLTIQPKTGIPIQEKYRFQSNIPMPDMTGYNKDLQRFSNMVVPTFWYEYDLDDLPLTVQILLKFTVFVTLEFQIIIVIILAIMCVYQLFVFYKICFQVNDLLHVIRPKCVIPVDDYLT